MFSRVWAWQRPQDQIFFSIQLEMIQNFLISDAFKEGVNNTNWCLFPRKRSDKLQLILGLLLYVMWLNKIVIKILDSFISPRQAAFISRREILDNLVVAQELIHSMSRKSRKSKLIAFKTDMSKEYDMLEWPFLIQALKLVSLLPHFYQTHWSLYLHLSHWS